MNIAKVTDGVNLGLQHVKRNTKGWNWVIGGMRGIENTPLVGDVALGKYMAYRYCVAQCNRHVKDGGDPKRYAGYTAAKGMMAGAVIAWNYHNPNSKNGLGDARFDQSYTEAMWLKAGKSLDTEVTKP